MLSLITPTMWQFKHFCDNLSYILQLPVVDEIIIINNFVQETPDHPVLNHPKVRLINQEKNIYVNPAWNLGAKLAKNDKLVFLSDDVIVDLKVFFKVDEHLNEDIGVLTMGVPHDIYYIQAEYRKHQREDLVRAGLHLVTGLIDFMPGQFGVGAGSFFAIHKNNWIDIPPEFLVHFGDVWIFRSMEYKNKQNYSILNCFYYSPWSVTAGNLNLHPDIWLPSNKHTIENQDYTKARLENYHKGVPMPPEFQNFETSENNV